MSQVQIAGISVGKKEKPPIVVIYGPDGVGKSSFGADAPMPVFLGPEDGTSNLDVARFDGVTTFADIRKNVKRLMNEKLPFQTCVLDSLDHIEPLLWKEICVASNAAVIEDAFGGFGRGFTRANQLWAELIADLKWLRDNKKMNIIAIAHSQIKTMNDPSQPLPYDRYMLKLNEKAAALWRESADAVLFVNYETVVRKEKKSDQKAKAYGEDKRILFTQRRPSHDAKNRYGLPYEMPFELGFAWNVFADAVKNGQPDSLQAVLGEIAELAGVIGEANATRMNAAVEKAQGDITKLINIRNHARVLASQAGAA